ncbi:MAG: imidazole glycerol phosphate synthase subunit HisH [Saprospiraceae bacterium]|nr:imidazole glycerol phosphate synthase subunit HisH [Saprospiraceae bacterium]
MTAIIDYDAGNTRSVMNALKYLGVPFVLSDDPDKLWAADQLILPGVGHASPAMKILNEKGLTSLIKNYKKPLLGICLGMQLLCNYSEEGDTDCLGIFNCNTEAFDSQIVKKVPHMGWNKVVFQNDSHPLLKGIKNESFMYFVHSYYITKMAYTIASTEYVEHFSSVIQKDNFFGMQFHPEKSGNEGIRFISNFLKL